jgi:ATP-dependent Clp protease protease subunit
MERDTFMDPDEAKKFGLIDEVVESRPELPGDDEGSQDKS